jgi:CRISPR-associated exonuclease Cas4
MFTEDDLLPLSVLQHLLFCERQCALIHAEQQWDENRYTAEGRIMHERADTVRSESRKDIRKEFGVALRSFKLDQEGPLVI